MIEQFEVVEIQNKSRIPYVFDVSDYTENRTPEAAKNACEEAANAKYHEIMVAAYGGVQPYCGATMRHFIDRDVVASKDELIIREVSE